MALTCTDCGLEHDFDNGPDTGECISCGGELVENDEGPVDKSQRLREIMNSTINGLAYARGMSRESVIATLQARGYTIPRQAKRLN